MFTRSISVMSVTISSPLMANSLHSANDNHSFGVPGPADNQYVVGEELDAYSAILAKKPKMGVSEIQEIAKKQEEWQFQYSEKCGLNIEVIDDTALIEISLNGKGKFNRNRQEIETEKKAKQRGGKARRRKKTVEKRINSHASVEKKVKDELVVVYSREEMENLRFEDLECQKKKWVEVYCGLGALVAEEYDGLVRSANINKKHNVSSFDFDRRPLFQKSANLDAVAAMGKGIHLNIFVH